MESRGETGGVTLGLRTLGTSVWQVGTHLTAAFVANVCAVLLSLPLLLALSAIAHATSLSVLPLGVALLLGILPNPLLAGLQLASHAILTSDTLSIGEQWQGIRERWKLTLPASLIDLAIAGVILLNVIFYPQIGGDQGTLHILAGPLEVIWLSILLFWLATHLYLYPLLLRMEQPSLLLAYRNAAAIVMARPLFTLIVMAGWLIWLVFTATTGPAYVVGLTLAAAIQQQALTRILPTFAVGSTMTH